MKGFEAVTLGWGGAKYTVAPEDQLRLIAQIEEALSDDRGTPAVVALLGNAGGNYARLSGAYGAALRYAGADVRDEDVYLAIVDRLSLGDAEMAAFVQGAVLGLLSIIAPPVHRRLMSEDAPGKP